ncbi:MAG: type IV pilus biogenesis/stability protein PilW [Methylococcales symbiont of Hymedesmia sp. n. MRB-2018]|nr:MAG: type IV pilus biogenesis/stability protein PilW [Methylococcales symbiont of Hymedesmia sp. n. MRB-2018]KAF3984113.1 MAG: type IV pilus biogenesis/stability protein PilW [Methylococcales symbiont of Hymedesmia sp. n. MRB-2018]
MLFNRIYSCLTITLLCIFIPACVPSKATKAMSTEERSQLYLQMGVRYLDMDMIKTAKEKLDIALELNANNAEVHNALGVLHERLAQDSLAEKHYQQAISLAVDDFSIKNNYGRFLCESGEYKKGIELLKQALAIPLNNRKWFAYTNIGRCQLINANKALAESNFRHALQENSQYPPALQEMQKISYDKRRYLSARGFLQRYLAVARQTSETLWYAVQTERGLGNKAMADHYREKLFALFPSSKQAVQMKAVIKIY